MLYWQIVNLSNSIRIDVNAIFYVYICIVYALLYIDTTNT